MKLTHHLVAATLLGLVCLSNTFAADGVGKAGGPVAQACRQDVQTLCPDIQPGDGRVKACMRTNHAKLSDGCKAAIKARHKNPAK